jgi:hypothetical protein
MFVVLNSEASVIHFDLSGHSNYSYVTLVEFTCSESGRVYVLADFVHKSFVDGKSIGLLGISGVVDKYYVPINIRRQTLGLTLVSEDLNIVKPRKCQTILHFKK